MAKHDITAAEVRAALEAHGWVIAEAARALDLPRKTLDDMVSRYGIRDELVEQRQHVLPGHVVSGVSTLVKDGETVIQWIKTKKADETVDSLIEAVKEAFADSRAVPVIKAPKTTKKDLCVVYPMGDPHIGLYSWAAETGADFDLEIAERTLVAAMQSLVAVAPEADQALIVNLGDFFHSDSQDNKTRRSGHDLDVDTRWTKVLRVGIGAMRACIEAALTKHRRVRVINEIGNHDDHTAIVLTEALKLLYEKNKRVEFDDSPALFHYYRFGQCLIGVTHGDKVKPEQLGGIMATDKPEDWGSTKHRIWLTGHIHHRRVVEIPGCLVESFRTLAARDAWSSGMGYRSGRDMNAIILHKENGELGRHRVDAMMLQ